MSNTTTVQENIKICMDIDQQEKLNTNLIQKCIETHQHIVSNRFNVLEKQYEGKHKILNRVIDDPDKPNNKLVTNFCAYVTDILTGFFMGKPITYDSENKEYLKILKDILKNNDETYENHTLAHKSSIKGQAFELVYLDEEGNICFNNLDTDGVIVIYDNTIKHDMNCAIRYYIVKDILDDKNNITKVEVYTKKYIYYYTLDDKNKMIFDEQKEHYYDEVPIIEFPNNRFRRSDFEGIISLNDSYNLNYADISNDIEYFSNCYLILENMAGTNKDDIKMINKNRTILTSENGKAYFLEKNINDTITQNHRNNISEDIHKLAYVPDLSKELPANLSGSAIKQKFFPTEQVIINKERMFNKAIQKRLRLITKILNKKGHDFNENEIEINFHRNIPVNLVEFADSVSKIVGTVSTKTLLKEMSNYIHIDDIDKEYQEMQKENASLDLDKIGEENGQEHAILDK
ncbi:phage portal protein [Clostridium botulinum]|uniref:phage portal protein n=1 Tax=Clostridium botulinum TaxID=1491 RepID=UPI001E2CDBA0|nr:phage portal protein [Clostridium botulinum]MCD3254376.1 phage portal protein [Clostridium botulinum C/D]MCD3279876.1 phage portal protein [Clostridium botulinum C/D]MCD3339607.1 phage portal protein [Clostridium botulinum C/D]MCD3357515.1 phage portal protein [Clostridium botulinum C/D]